MLNIIKNQCCGCMACMNICPVDAISEIQDDEGFIYPKVEEEKCILCGRCLEVCDWRREKQVERNTLKTYSLKHNDREVLRLSTSGGAFTALSDVMIDDHGVVAAARMNSDFSVNHVMASTKSERDDMRGSKYTQSDIGYMFRDIKNRLLQGEKVMFVGAPCQAAGLRNYLGKKNDGVLIIDFLCHGVPNNLLFQRHVQYLEGLYQRKAKDYKHRSKYYGWISPSIEEIIFDNNDTKRSLEVQSYFHFFIGNISLRPSCFNCRYRSYHRASDLTIADFWGIEKLTKEYDTQGVSLILVNSAEGQHYLSRTSDCCDVTEVPYEKVSYRISTKTPKPAKPPEAFWDMYLQHGYEAAVKRYFDLSLKARARLAAKKAIRRLEIKKLMWNTKSIIKREKA